MSLGFNGFCPRCNSEIPAERYATGHAICTCGWVDDAPMRSADRKNQHQAITIMAGAALLVVLAFAHSIYWGAHTFEGPALKLQQVTGTLSKPGFERLAQICIQLNRWPCAREAYLDMQRSTGDLEGLALLARLQVKLEENEAALATLGSYFRTGGRDGQSALQYAKLLENAGSHESALKYYEASIELRPQVLPVQATTGIVRILMKLGRLEEAQARIIAFHESAENAKGYLNTELAQLEKVLGPALEEKDAKSGVTHKRAKRFASR